MERKLMSAHDLVEADAAAVSDGDFDALQELVHNDATFDGTVVREASGSDAFVQGFKNWRPIMLRTEVRSVVVDDDHAAIMYDLVTDTPVGSVLCSEFLSLENGTVRGSTLIFDWRRWPEVIAELQARTGPTTA